MNGIIAFTIATEPAIFIARKGYDAYASHVGHSPPSLHNNGTIGSVSFNGMSTSVLLVELSPPMFSLNLIFKNIIFFNEDLKQL